MINDLNPLAEMRKIIQKRRRAALEKNENIRLILSILRTVAIFALFIILFTLFFSFRIVKGNEMFPALQDGDLTLVYKQSKYVKNDVIFFNEGGKEKIARVVAKSGDIVQITEEGDLLVNGTTQVGAIVYKTFPRENWEGPVKVPEGCVFVLGDNRMNSRDSRDFGFVKISDVKGKTIVLFRHIDI